MESKYDCLIKDNFIGKEDQINLIGYGNMRTEMHKQWYFSSQSSSTL
jgi:hypothetical protein